MAREYNKNINVICYGLRTDYLTHLFEGSKRLFEIADKFEELPSYCECGNKNSVNAKIDQNGNINKVYGGANQSGDVINTNINTPSSNNQTVENASLTMEVTHKKSYDVQPHVSSSQINVTINNNSSKQITKWNAYIMTTESTLANNWSQASIEYTNNIYLISEINQYYGTNPIPSYRYGSSRIQKGSSRNGSRKSRRRKASK